MDIKLDKQLKALRKEKNVTQEELARHLGITVQAVSKWERAEGFPDISLLPSIASFFDISVDDLLGVGEIAKRKKIEDYCKKDDELFHDGKCKARVEMWREAKKEFPNDHQVVYNLMYALMAEDQKGNADEIILLGERILDESTDNRKRGGAIQCLAFTYYLAKGDAEKAKEYANMADWYSGTVNEIMPVLLEGEEAVQYCQHNIQQLFEMIWRNTVRMTPYFSNEDSIKANRFVLDCFNLLYEDGDFDFYHCRMSDIYQKLAGKYKLLNKIDEMFDCLEKAAEHTLKYDTRTDGKHTSFTVNRIETRVASSSKDYEENDSALLLNLLGHEFYADVQNDSRMKAIKAKLEKTAVY